MVLVEFLGKNLQFLLVYLDGPLEPGFLALQEQGALEISDEVDLVCHVPLE